MPDVFPNGFLAAMEQVPGFEAEPFVHVHESGKQLTSIRINPFKFSREKLPFTNTRNIPWCTNGLYLPERPSFTRDPLFHAGAYYVQEASSMFLEQAFVQLLDLTKPLRVLDLCAAPGGKSTHILSLISPESLLVSNEIIQSRVNILSENIIKWGPANVIVTSNDPKEFNKLDSFFDVIVVDAPCSGSGLFRKDPKAMDEWSAQAVNLCSQRQQRILADVMSSLKPGGLLIYSTCSYSVEEDEEIADWLINGYDLMSEKLSVEPEWKIVESVSPERKAFGYRFFPDKLDGEGFFLSAFRKSGGINHNKKSSPRKNSHADVKLAGASDKSLLSDWINHAELLTLIHWNNGLLGFPSSLMDDLLHVKQHVYIKKAGVQIGMLAHKDIIPDHELAMSVILHHNLPTVNVEADDALQFLRKADMQIATGIRGWALISFQQIPLGWVKILPNRINNYYPKDWRILNK